MALHVPDQNTRACVPSSPLCLIGEGSGQLEPHPEPSLSLPFTLGQRLLPVTYPPQSEMALSILYVAL